jgi:S-formylglutathione hydrolase FrmB
MKNTITSVPLYILLLLAASAHAEKEVPTWSDERGTWRHMVDSPFQTGPSLVEVLLPDHFDKAKKYRVLYLLPVEVGEGIKFGDGMKVARALGLHNKYALIVVAPTFDVMPWFGNHATNPQCRQEDHMVKTVVPFIESHYPTIGTAEGRLLLGYSKSGWGALTLILRNPDVFGYAASWDAPLMFTENQCGVWGTLDNFGTAETMAQFLPSTLVRARAEPFKTRTRLVVAGLNKFGTLSDRRFPFDGPSHTEAFHELAESCGVQHLFNAGIKANHSWNPQWMQPVVAMLMKLSEKDIKP